MSPIVNIVIIIACVFITSAVGYWFGQMPPPAPQTAKPNTMIALAPAPDFSAQDLNGKTHRLSDFRGRPIVLNFWASWCAPCVAEFPILLAAAEKNPDLVIIAISADTERAPIQQFLKRLPDTAQKALKQSNVIIIHDPSRAIMQTQYHTYRLPETFLINRDQEIQQKWIGNSFTVDDLLDAAR